MLSPDTLKTWISEGLACDHLEVEGDGHHFSALIVSKAFEGLSRVKRQQILNGVLKAHFDTGVLHALSMKTLTPEEWKSHG